MKAKCSRDGKIILVAENGAEEFLLDKFLPINGGSFAVESWGIEFVGISERRSSVTLYPGTQPNKAFAAEAEAGPQSAQDSVVSKNQNRPG